MTESTKRTETLPFTLALGITQWISGSWDSAIYQTCSSDEVMAFLKFVVKGPEKYRAIRTEFSMTLMETFVAVYLKGVKESANDQPEPQCIHIEVEYEEPVDHDEIKKIRDVWGKHFRRRVYQGHRHLGQDLHRVCSLQRTRIQGLAAIRWKMGTTEL